MAIQINGNGTITGISVGGLPDGIVDTDMIANSAVTSAKSSGLGGLSMAQQWSIATSGGEYTINTSNTDITSGWYAVSSANQAGTGSIGLSMTESSGIFTFPSTGIYFIQFTAQMYTFSPGSSGANYYVQIYTSTDSGSNYIRSTYNSGAIPGLSGSPNANIVTTLLFDVTNTSTHKVKFTINASQTSRLYTSPGDRIYTGVIFQKLGDT